MENLFLTQLSVSEIRQLLREEISSVLCSQNNNHDSSSSDDLLTIAQASGFLNLSVATIYGLVSKSKIPYNKPGKRLYFSRAELTEWVKQGRRSTIAEQQAAAICYTKNRRA